MLIAYWALLQLASYSLATWVGFISIAFFAARLIGKPGIIPGHVLVAMAVASLDVRWIQSEVHKPGWTGQPDMDIVFIFGVLVRIILVNTALLPISILALRTRRQTPRKAVGSVV